MTETPTLRRLLLRAATIRRYVQLEERHYQRWQAYCQIVEASPEVRARETWRVNEEPKLTRRVNAESPAGGAGPQLGETMDRIREGDTE